MESQENRKKPAPIVHAEEEYDTEDGDETKNKGDLAEEELLPAPPTEVVVEAVAVLKKKDDNENEEVPPGQKETANELPITLEERTTRRCSADEDNRRRRRRTPSPVIGVGIVISKPSPHESFNSVGEQQGGAYSSASSGEEWRPNKDLAMKEEESEYLPMVVLQQRRKLAAKEQAVVDPSTTQQPQERGGSVSQGTEALDSSVATAAANQDSLSTTIPRRGTYRDKYRAAGILIGGPLPPQEADKEGKVGSHTGASRSNSSQNLSSANRGFWPRNDPKQDASGRL